MFNKKAKTVESILERTTSELEEVQSYAQNESNRQQSIIDSATVQKAQADKQASIAEKAISNFKVLFGVE